LRKLLAAGANPNEKIAIEKFSDEQWSTVWCDFLARLSGDTPTLANFAAFLSKLGPSLKWDGKFPQRMAPIETFSSPDI
jgi:hypothetical protein